MTLTEKKEKHYQRLATEAERWHEIDDRWSNTDPPDSRWEQSRLIDDGLYVSRSDDTVNETQYRAKCLELWALYTSA